MPDVTLRGICKSFGSVEILRDIDLEVKDGEFCVFVGPSGCGKTTLLRIIAGLETVTAGELMIGDRRVNDLPPADRRIAMVFQSYALYPHMSVYRNIAFGLKFSGGNKADLDGKVRKVAEILKLTPLLDRKPRDLSGGQRQRVAIGRAIVREPSVFLFDEPLSNLDAALRVNTRIEIAKLHRELSATMIYVTHDQVEAMTLASKIVVLNQGRIEQVGSPLDLYHRPRNLFVAGFIGSPGMNMIKARILAVEGASAIVGFGGDLKAELPVARGAASPGQEVTIGIRPEHMSDATDGMLSLAGDVDAVERLGEASYIYMHLDDGTNVTVRVPGDSPVEAGTRATASAVTGAVHLFNSEGICFARVEPGRRERSAN
jgi:ABC-type sugar transport system ATPase subunit